MSEWKICTNCELHYYYALYSEMIKRRDLTITNRIINTEILEQIEAEIARRYPVFYLMAQGSDALH